MKKIMYRSEDSYGSGIRDILDVMVFEIYELENTDILDYCLKHYLQNTMLEDIVKDVIDNVISFSEEEIYSICRSIVDEINSQTNHNLKYALWLADKDTVIDMYADTEESILAYKTSDVILANLGRDGILFAYDNRPLPINF